MEEMPIQYKKIYGKKVISSQSLSLAEQKGYIYPDRQHFPIPHQFEPPPRRKKI